MKTINKKGFSLAELIITVVIIGTLSVIAYVGINGTGNWFKNEKVKDDLIVISNALERYKRDHFGSYPIQEPGDNANMLCFAADASYAHDCDSAAFRQGMIDNNLLTKRYLQEVPTDPRTDSRYVYGVSADGKYFQVAGVVHEDGDYRAETVENLGQGFFLPSLIRSYDSPNFVVHESTTNLPYSPSAMVISAKLQNFDPLVVTVTDENDVAVPDVSDPALTLYEGYTITTNNSGSVDIYFSDGSMSTLDPNSELEILDTSDVEENDSDNIVTKIYLKLTQGKIWNKVVRLASESEFNIETTSAIAGVRGTEFGVDADLDKITVYSGSVWVGEDDDLNLVSGTPNVPQIADMTELGPDNIGAADLADYVDYYDNAAIHNGLVPYIVAVEEDDTLSKYGIYVSFNGIRIADDYELTNPSISGIKSAVSFTGANDVCELSGADFKFQK